MYIHIYNAIKNGKKTLAEMEIETKKHLYTAIFLMLKQIISLSYAHQGCIYSI